MLLRIWLDVRTVLISVMIGYAVIMLYIVSMMDTGSDIALWSIISVICVTYTGMLLVKDSVPEPLLWRHFDLVWLRRKYDSADDVFVCLIAMYLLDTASVASPVDAVRIETVDAGERIVAKYMKNPALYGDAFVANRDAILAASDTVISSYHSRNEYDETAIWDEDAIRMYTDVFAHIATTMHEYEQRSKDV